MKIYLAGPFFNDAQNAIIDRLETLIESKGFELYSPRRDSGSASFSPEDRANPDKWRAVFDSNVRNLHDADLVFAVLDYAGVTVAPIERHGNQDGPVINLPDTGTVWEIGYANAIEKTVVGYRIAKPEKENLMLQFGIDSVVYGMNDALFFERGHINWSATGSSFEGATI